MALKPCRECKKDVSTEAKTCPHCGAKDPTKKPSSKLGWIGLGAFALLCTAAVSGRKKPDVEQANAVAPALPVVASSAPEVTKPSFAFTEAEAAVFRWLLVDDLKGFAQGADTMAAEVPAIGQGRIVATADEIQRAYEANEVAADAKYRGKGVLVRGTVDSINRSIGDNHFVALRGGSNMFIKPNAKMANGHVGYLAQLNKGEKITLACNVDGMLVGSAWLDECEPLESWIESNVMRISAALPERIAAGDREMRRLATGAIIISAAVPPTNPCWGANSCMDLALKARGKASPELKAQIATRLGLTEADAQELFEKKPQAM